MTCSYNDIVSQKHKNRNPFVSELRFMFGGEGEIRTLEPFYRLHDFQSCALDQLGDFSIRYFVFALSLECLYILSQVFRNVNTFFEIFSIFFGIFLREKNCDNFFKTS